MLVDLPNSRFYFFFIELWPQEVYYFTGLLIVAALTLFLMNAVGGRIWCGYLCPQTVWTDLFYAVERWIEGDRRERMRKDAAKGRCKLERLADVVLKHSIWLMIAWWTGGAWVLYFADAPTLVKQLVTFQAPMIAYIWIGILTATTYTLAGFMREQVCVYMCPWPRIQAALTDEWALNVTYRYDRGEPRGSAEEGNEPARRAAGRRLHRLLPMRRRVPDRHRHPQRPAARLHPVRPLHRRLRHRDDQDRPGNPPDRLRQRHQHSRRREAGKPPIYRIVRPRTVIYAAMIAGRRRVIMLYALLTPRCSTSTCCTTAIRSR